MLQVKSWSSDTILSAELSKGMQFKGYLQIDSCGSVTFDPILKSQNPFSYLCFLESNNIIVSVSNFQTRILAFWWVSATYHPFIAYKWRPVLTSVNVGVFCNLGDTQQCQYQHFFHTTQDKNIINKNLEIIWKTVTCRLSL